jgi:hypothetical protein
MNKNYWEFINMKLCFRAAIISLLLYIVVFSLFFISCNPKSQEFSTIWSSDKKSYRTNELVIAQQETPFEIVLPEYIPDDLLPLPFIQGTIKSEFNSSRPIRIMYYRHGEDFNPILIEEYSTPMTYQSSDNFTYLNILGIDVREETTTMLKDITTFIPQYHYSWNMDSIHYNVSIAEFETDEGRKVVESMIKQIK